jgi:anti-sigma regulatory factor (Ser/Thr protein kinase)
MEHLRGKLTIGCDIVEAEKLSEKLVALLAGLDTRAAGTLRLGLKEILINAIEHGSLEITFDEKSDESSKADYLEFLMERQKHPQYASRTVTVDYHITQAKATFRISDQGKGFDHKRICASAAENENNLDLSHGRGIKMSLRIFDRIRYNSQGNRVTLIKRLPSNVTINAEIDSTHISTQLPR